MSLFLYIILGIVALVAFLGFIAPKSYHVKRSIIINRPLPEVFNYLKLIKNQDYWSPWKKKDPNMKQETVGTDGNVGFINKWEGNKDVGTGEQEIMRIVENDIVESQLRFYKPWKSQSDAYIKVNKVDDQNTEVVWGFSGKNKFPSSIFMMLYNIDKHVGKDFDEGLASLKEILEQ
ncbi:MAG: SRPBCC family protein [Gelidibacter sp.]|nr:SRPBCC family protein [Gelidibacter sp.]